MDRLDFDRLDVRQFYGQSHAGLAASDLSAGLNVVYGPNGQGKTTLARALHGVLWPASVAEHRPSYEAHFTVGGRPWRASFDAGLARYQEDGAASDAPPVPDASVAPRYLLSLRDLLTDDGATFAETVRTQAQGGVDLAARAADLGYRASLPRRLDASGHARQAADDLRARRQELDALREDEATLSTLEGLADAAALASEEAEALALVDTLLVRRRDAARAQGEADAFPAAVRRVAEDTADRYRTLGEAVAAAESRVDAARRSLDGARAARTAQGWAETAPPTPDALTSRARRVTDATRTVEEAERTRAAAQARLADARTALGDAEDRPVTPEAVVEVAQHVSEAVRLQTRLAAVEEREKMFRTAHQKIPFQDSDRLRQAIRLLRQWLAFTTEEATQQMGPAAREVWIGAGVVALVSVLAAWAWNPWALVGVVGAAGLAVVAWRLGLTPPPEASPAERARLAYGALPVAPPPAWTPVAVETLLDQLQHDEVEEERRQMLQSRAEEAGRDKHEAETNLQDAVRTGRTLGARLGVGYPDEPAAFLVHVQALQRAHQAALDAAAAEGAVASAREQLGTALEAFNAAVAGLPVPSVRDADDAEAVVLTVRRQTDERDRLQAEVDRAEATMTEEEARRDEALAARAAFLDTLGLDAPDDAAVARLCEHRAPYTAAAHAAQEAAALAQEADRRARAHPRFREALLTLDRPALARLTDEAHTHAGRRDGHLEEAARIRERVEQARRTHALSLAAARHERSLDALDAVYDSHADALVGHRLAEAVAEETRDEHLPRVFGRARDLLADITADRYRLTFRDGAFRAEDTARGWTHGLDELSAGTRLQLLLAVRLAFVEAQEAGLRLPLLLDEALANSDDDKATAIAQAVFRLCALGRQVFYFTARADEVATWRRLAEQFTDVPVRFVTLGNAELPALDTLPAEPTTRALPVPNGQTADAYAAAVGAPAWSGWDPIDALPVSSLLDTAKEVHPCLAAGYAQWGPLVSAARRGVDVPVPMPTLVRMETRARAVEAWQAAWREGRGRRLDRTALAACEAVSENFLDAIAELAAAHDGDARATLAALNDGAVRHFGPAKTERLEDALAHTGYLADGSALDDDALRRRVAEALPEAEAFADALAILARLRERWADQRPALAHDADLHLS